MNRTKLSEWSAAVKARDGKCLDCGSLKDLHAHHDKPKSTHPELALDLDNGRTLCYRCHKATHERMRERGARLGRSNRPQRKTLEKRIAELERELVALQLKIEQQQESVVTEKRKRRVPVVTKKEIVYVERPCPVCSESPWPLKS